MTSDILLESGTGEVEVIEFRANDVNYAINVIKVKEIIDMPASGVTKMPESKKEIAGLILCRDEILPVIDLKYILNREKSSELGQRLIVCEFNKVKVAFNIDDIIGVHRIKWSDIRKPNNMFDESLAVGNIVLNGKIIVMLDFEKIVTDISPKSGISEDRLVSVEYKDRSELKLVLADDSPLIRKLLRETLTKAGFTNMKIFDDGEQALDYLEGLKKDLGKSFVKEVQLLITDIEMPQMDGLTLTRKVKEDEVLKRLPVIIFSSLITDDLRHKGESVGADAQLSKPEIEELIGVVDQLLGI
ncbi:chemotaxis protein [Clostridium paraputrificum]|uniref:chemotaxis protein n=1 Tax=Clostridium TaxID=1485 RepID=UPI00189F9517|nr:MULTISPECIES: chemotaxis protein [Clostridium]MDB2076915.1 chemotaxis protein [Clostridium paraputrificum]MDB2080392.1 chemotaxis protein [Clostridium paraputrificum]MDB2087210.1 chemotaxis protein [Clostridium paraputrificum]MDB2099592.1 chemotaxis protein [Clostridium paraputrificum]MDB2121066.1 chemotaxis protein [Clostridium paraputrificum]